MYSYTWYRNINMLYVTTLILLYEQEREKDNNNIRWKYLSQKFVCMWQRVVRFLRQLTISLYTKFKEKLILFIHWFFNLTNLFELRLLLRPRSPSPLIFSIANCLCLTNTFPWTFFAFDFDHNTTPQRSLLLRTDMKSPRVNTHIWYISLYYHHDIAFHASLLFF